jgi:hypothetical protein
MERVLETSSGANEGSDVPHTAHYNRNLKQDGVLHRRRSFPGWDLGHLRHYLGQLRDYLGHLRDYLGHLRDYLGHLRIYFFPKTTQIFLKVL